MERGQGGNDLPGRRMLATVQLQTPFSRALGPRARCQTASPPAYAGTSSHHLQGSRAGRCVCLVLRPHRGSNADGDLSSTQQAQRGCSRYAARVFAAPAAASQRTLLIRYSPRKSRDWGAAMQPTPNAQPLSLTCQVWELPMTGRETPLVRRVAQQALSLRCAANALLRLHLPLSRTPASRQLLPFLLIRFTRQPLWVLLGATWHISEHKETASIDGSP